MLFFQYFSSDANLLTLVLSLLHQFLIQLSSIFVEDLHDVPDSGRTDHTQSAIAERTKSKDQIKAAQQIDDIFGDEEGLPGESNIFS